MVLAPAAIKSNVGHYRTLNALRKAGDEEFLRAKGRRGQVEEEVCAMDGAR
ncbi:hypothetical protein [Franzmannia qiaohouensis]|uniref:Uncharacterized protein n=1 Tax=Franzmannia qiaohouensis TaxID=1329370 RepID=A0ABU1HGB2_9GAMM|nr:hypothetical protein [Halomonas qiaohouensis]MDR5906341.1 hypothetical protein [Halomonas qiaohouensis]